jgi:hypothetical protein
LEKKKMNARRKKLFRGMLILLVVFVLCIGTTVYADIIYDFHIFNDPAWQNDSRLNFTVNLSDEGQNKVGFLFENSSSISSSVTAIYFDDDSILDIADNIIEGLGVNFSFGATPKSLPAGNNLIPPFAKTPAFSADSNSPTSPNGINPNEWLKITFMLKTGKSFSDVTDAISRGGTTSQNDLRIGLHIQSLPGGCDDSVSAINDNFPIPEPATICLFGIGALSLFSRKK